MRRVLLGDRNSGHRQTLKDIFEKLDASLQLDFAGNGHDMLLYLAERPPDGLPDLIVLDPAIPFVGHGQLITLLKSDHRVSHIPIVIWTDQAGFDYHQARATGYAVMSFLKPSLPGGWDLLAHKMLTAIGREGNFTNAGHNEPNVIDIHPQ